MDMLDILLPALCAGLLVMATHIPLGKQVLKRDIIFIDLAIAQIAGLGAVIMAISDVGHHLPFAQYFIAVVFALIGAALIAYFEKTARQHLEALIGCLYVLSATAAFLLLANDPHGGDLLKQVLSGQILWVTYSDLGLYAFITALALVAFWLKPQLLSGHAFYFVFAIIITGSVQTVGVFLVFSTLIIPALATVNVGKHKYAWAYGIGIMAYITGLWSSATWDLPSGACIVWMLAVWAIVFTLLKKVLPIGAKA